MLSPNVHAQRALLRCVAYCEVDWKVPHPDDGKVRKTRMATVDPTNKPPFKESASTFD